MSEWPLAGDGLGVVWQVMTGMALQVLPEGCILEAAGEAPSLHQRAHRAGRALGQARPALALSLSLLYM